MRRERRDGITLAARRTSVSEDDDEIGTSEDVVRRRLVDDPSDDGEIPRDRYAGHIDT